MSKKPKVSCEFCKSGNKPNRQGEHIYRVTAAAGFSYRKIEMCRKWIAARKAKKP